MMIINQDILDIGTGIIAHQCNCQGVMGAGLARAIRNIFPSVYTEYRELYAAGKLTLGMTQLVFIPKEIAPNLAVANLMAQEFYGRDRVYTDYMALRKCLSTLGEYQRNAGLPDIEWPIYLPYKIGCGLAGGDWKIVSKIIEEELPHAIICRKG